MNANRDPEGVDRLFREYVQALVAALESARKNYDSSALRPPFQGGAPPLAADPRVLAVIRRFFLAYDKLCKAAGGGVRRPPHEFIMERLSPRHDDLLKHLLELTYLPIGVDEKEEWV